MIKSNRPLLRWAGSKRSILPELANFIPSRQQVYVEPFCGSAALFFYLRPKRAILSDLNGSLINFYRQARNHPKDVYSLATSLPRNKKTYLDVRRHFNTETDSIERAAYFFYLNRNCFNGLYRTDKAGHFNVPFSRSRTGAMLPEVAFIEQTKRLRNVRLKASDFETIVVSHAKAETFFFLDPPYAVSWRRPFTDYIAGSFGRSDLSRLTGCLEHIDDAGAEFLLTYDSRLAGQFPFRRNWTKRKIWVRRNISGFASARRNSIEIAITNVAR